MSRPANTVQATPPIREQPDPSTVRGKLVVNVRDALTALPGHFTSRTHIEGLEAGDIFSLNSMLGGSIEIQVVETLNRLRAVWDPDNEWEEYAFVRSSQTFPDVRLRTSSTTRVVRGEEVILGLELKGWYLLSREQEPSFRYSVSRAVCDIHDLLVVVPWHLSNVLSGEPIVYSPFIESARYCADMRNYYWQVSRREADIDRHQLRSADYYDIRTPTGLSPYPPAKSAISDHAVKDSGKNFGRIARSKGLMDDYVSRLLETPIAGIEARHWTMFFRTYSEGAQQGELHDRVVRQLAKHYLQSGVGSAKLERLLEEWANRLPASEGLRSEG